MKALFLHGINCTKVIWDTLIPLLPSWNCEILSYPHTVTQKATCLSDLAEWVSAQTAGKRYDAVVGHSLGGLIALELAARHLLSCGQIICLDTNLKPAGAFFRSLMTKEHVEQYGSQITAMMAAERPHYTPALIRSLQDEFDYTKLLSKTDIPVCLLMGDRGQADAAGHIADLHLPPYALEKLQIQFVSSSCHMPMIENPKGLAELLMEICR